MRNKRKEMGEESWSKYQIERKQEKAKLWRAKNVQNVVDWRRRTKEKRIKVANAKNVDTRKNAHQLMIFIIEFQVKKNLTFLVMELLEMLKN
jgi:hypothetical protein